MTIRLMHQGYFEILGEGNVLLTAPHAGGPVADILTGEIVEQVALQANCHALVGNTSRAKIDLNRTEAFETDFRESIERFIEKNGIRLIIDVHGKEKTGVEVGTALGQTASEITTNLVTSCLSEHFQVEVNKKYKGLKHGSIITTHSRKDSSGRYMTEAVQLEFGLKERHLSRDKAVSGIAEIVRLVNGKARNG